MRFGNLRQYLDTVLCHAPDDGGGGGQGGDKPLTKDDVQSMINEAISTGVNGAVKSQLNRIDFGSMIETAMAPVLDKLQSGQQQGGEQSGQQQGGQGGDDGQGGDQQSTGNEQLDALMAEVRKEREARKALEENIKQQEQAAKSQEERRLLQQALVGANVRPELLDGAIGVLHGGDKPRVTRNKAGEIVWSTGDQIDPFKPLDEGVKEWAGSDVGKAYLAPRQVRGGGNTGGDPEAGGSGGEGGVGDREINAYIMGDLR